jgi:hypothetical protein
MLPLWKKWDGISPDGEKRHEAIGVSTTAGPHARTCLHMGCREAPTHGYVTPVRCYEHRLGGMESFGAGPHATLHEANPPVEHHPSV